MEHQETKLMYNPKAYEEIKKEYDNTNVISWVGSADIAEMIKCIAPIMVKPSEITNAKNKELEDFRNKILNDKEFEKNFVQKILNGDLVIPEEKWKNGPIKTFVNGSNLKEVFLIYSADFIVWEKLFKAWISRGTNAPITNIKTQVSDAYSVKQVSQALVSTYHEYWSKHDHKSLVFLVTSGTATIVSTMMYISQILVYPSRCYVTKGVDHSSEKPFEELKVDGIIPNSLEAEQDSTITTLREKELDRITQYCRILPSLTILILGATGAGKSTLARRLHESTKKGLPYQEVNCAEISAGDGNMFRAELFGAVKGSYTGCNTDKEGIFDKAKDGTIFLDEIGDIPYDKQSILLRVLESRVYRPVGATKDKILSSVRIIAATNKDLVKEVEEGRFREDLYYRLASCPINLQSIKEIIDTSKKDFRKLVKDLLEQISSKKEDDLASVANISASDIDKLMQFDWPGNVRQLNLILRLACIRTKYLNHNRITFDDVKTELKNLRIPNTNKDNNESSNEEDTIPSNLDEWIEEKKLHFVKIALKESNNNLQLASRKLGVTYSRLHYFVEKNKLINDSQ